MTEAGPNPYSSLPQNAFWKSAVASHNPFEISGLWDPKYHIRPQHKVATFGSCFAQHVGRALRTRGFNWFITEQAPSGLSPAHQTLYNYDLFSARTGNIYTVSLLNQWIDWAFGEKTPPDEYWVSKGRFFDPFRPRVEPDGFESLEEMLACRQHTIDCFRRAIVESNVFVFTLGLTESWFNTAGYEYPMCPGTAGGTFDPAQHVFLNQDFDFIRTNLNRAIAKMREVNQTLRFLFTVSPVPLTATNSGRHVLVATMESKSVLRAVVAKVSTGRQAIDYFPSYEIVNSPVFGGRFFEPNLRSVSAFGVNFVMDSLFAAQEAKFGPVRSARAPGGARRRAKPGAGGAAPENSKHEDEVCEERLLEAFGSVS